METRSSGHYKDDSKLPQSIVLDSLNFLNFLNSFK